MKIKKRKSKILSKVQIANMADKLGGLYADLKEQRDKLDTKISETRQKIEDFIAEHGSKVKDASHGVTGAKYDLVHTQGAPSVSYDPDQILEVFPSKAVKKFFKKVTISEFDEEAFVTWFESNRSPQLEKKLKQCEVVTRKGSNRLNVSDLNES